jgi:pimeloyl-ACP methyl ester carboxylesterase
MELGAKIKKLAIYEVPYNDDENAQVGWKQYTERLMELVQADRKGDAVGHFMMLTGMPPEQLEGMRQHPLWPMWEAVGLTLAYDAIAMGEDSSVPVERAKRVSVPTLIITGSQTYPFMSEAAKTLAKAMPNARQHILEGQSHEVSAEALAPILIEFFKS